MANILLTPYDGAILGPIAKLLGWIMDLIYVFMHNTFGIESAGWSIIILTLLIYTLMFPMTYKQQKFTKLQQKMQPELKAIQDKYKNKKDEASVMAMNNETQMIYDKYGVNPMGSCLQMIVQMPIWFALYRVFYNIPAYITSVKDKFEGVAEEIVNVDGFADIIAKIQTDYKISLMQTPDFVVSETNTIENVKNYVIDVIYKIPNLGDLNTSEYFGSLESIHSIVNNGIDKFNEFNFFLGMNISDTPWNIITNNFNTKNYLAMVIPFAIPVIYYFVNKISLKLSTASTGKKDANDMMAQQMESMNKTMPIMMVFFCFITPVGLGLYWIVSAAYRALQQYLLNKHFDKIDYDVIIEKNKEKAKKKQEKRGVYENQIREAAAMKTRSIESKANIGNFKEVDEDAYTNTNKTYKPGSMAAKANMVREYNEKNSRK